MNLLQTLTVAACLGAPVMAMAQGAEPVDQRGFETVPRGSAAPTVYGWKLSDAEVSTTVMVDGVEEPLDLSAFFECGVALGREAAAYGYRPGSCIALSSGPRLQIHPAGALAVSRKEFAFDPVNIDAVLATRVDALEDLPDLFMPRLGDAAPLAGAGACPDPHGTRGVYFYATRMERALGLSDKMMITWNDILPAGDCDAAPNSFQMIVTALPLEPGAQGVRPPARVEFRYGDCGWAVPDQNALPPAPRGPDGLLVRDLDEVHGARSGILFNSAAPVGEVRRGIEVLGAREQDFTVSDPGTDDAGALAHDRQWGASGDPRRFADFCAHSNVNVIEGDRPKGRFVFDLTSEGVPLKDDDEDGVPEGLGPEYDNCPWIANPYQGNVDRDLYGDACDSDADADELPNSQEFCDLVESTIGNDYAQTIDTDGDGLGDGCDFDLDGDGVNNHADNCPEDANPSQFDWDIDQDGLRCDLDDGAVLVHIVALFVAAVDNGWTPGGPVIEVVDFARTQTMSYGTEGPSFAERWAAATGKSLDEVWALIDASLTWPLPQTQALSLRVAVDEAWAQTSDPDIWLLYEWSKTDLGLGEFVTKHGGWFVEGAD